MNTLVSFNLRISTTEKTFLSAISYAALYGKGVFTSLAVYNAKPFFWEKHWQRLKENSRRLNIDLRDFDEQTVKNALARIIAQNNLETGRARITLFDESASKIWNFDAQNKTSLLITTGDFQNTKDAYRLTVSPFPVNSKSPLAGIKSCNYMENLLALEEAGKQGFDEAVRVNENGEIVSASTANIFWAKNEKIFTPNTETGCLAGTTRAFLMENFAIEEKSAALDELLRADEVFLSSAGIGVKGVENINEKSFGGDLTQKLKRFFAEKTAGF